MALGLVYLQNLPYPPAQGRVYGLEALSHILMYGRDVLERYRWVAGKP